MDDRQVVEPPSAPPGLGLYRDGAVVDLPIESILDQLREQLERVGDALIPTDHLTRLRGLAARAVPLDWLPRTELITDELPQSALVSYGAGLPARPAETPDEVAAQREAGEALVAYVENLLLRAHEWLHRSELEQDAREPVRAATAEEVASSRASQAREAKRRLRWTAPVMRASRPRQRRAGARVRRAARTRRARGPQQAASDDDDGGPEPPGGPAGRRFEARSGGIGFFRLLSDDGELVVRHGAFSPAESAI
jgi:hypothetical protein